MKEELARQYALKYWPTEEGPMHQMCVADFLAGYTEGSRANGKAAWIPVSERLPENNQRVLCTQSLNKRVLLATFLSGDVFSYDGITHWMPLPEGPQENNQSNNL